MKQMTSVKIPKQLEQQMHEAIVVNGFGLRGKSRWVEEAVVRFLERPDFPELVDLASEMADLNKTISMRFSEDTFAEIENAIIKVRHDYPSLEGVKSNIIRASILQSLI